MEENILLFCTENEQVDQPARGQEVQPDPVLGPDIIFLAQISPLASCFHPSRSRFLLIKLTMPQLFCSLSLLRALFLIAINAGAKTKQNLSLARIVCKKAV